MIRTSTSNIIKIRIRIIITEVGSVGIGDNDDKLLFTLKFDNNGGGTE
jgi:hypothetical protein